MLFQFESHEGACFSSIIKRRHLPACVILSYASPPQQQAIANEIHLRHRTRQINSIRSCHSYSMSFEILSITDTLLLSLFLSLNLQWVMKCRFHFFLGFETFSYLRLSSSGLFFIQSFRLIHMQFPIGGVITISSGTDRKKEKRAREERRASFSVWELCQFRWRGWLVLSVGKQHSIS